LGGNLGQSSLISPPSHSVGEDARRSTRIERSVPLIVFGQNRMGEPFVERTVSTSLNLHGCRYPRGTTTALASWVTLQVVGLSVEPKPRRCARECGQSTRPRVRGNCSKSAWSWKTLGMFGESLRRPRTG